jgi:hypothetical protein
MMDAIALIAEGNFVDAGAIVTRALDRIVEQKMNVLRKIVGEVVWGEYQPQLVEGNIMRQGRTLVIRRRIRKGKLQRMVRKSAVKGFTLRRGKITRIPAAKRIRMRITQRRAARKRKSHMAATLRKRKLSMRKRKSMGIR